MTLVTLDQKMRLRLPKMISERLELKGREELVIELDGEAIRITKPKKDDIKRYPLLKYMIEHPLRTGVRITSELLDSVEEEMYL